MKLSSSSLSFGLLLFLSVVLLVACPGGDGTPDPIDSVEAGVQCEVVSGIPTWDFHFVVAGPASATGTLVYVDSEDVPNEYGYAMTLSGQNGQVRIEFDTEIRGTIDGENPNPGEIPFSCEDLSVVVVLFCATHESSLDEPCWACGNDTLGSPPDGSVGWVDCGLSD